MKKIAQALAVCLFPLLIGCGSGSTTAPKGTGPAPAPVAVKSKDLIIGKWEVVDDKVKGTQEFRDDGALIIVMEGIEMKGKYKFLEEDLVEAEMMLPGDKKVTQKLKVKVSKDELTTTDEDKKVDKFKRAK